MRSRYSVLSIVVLLCTLAGCSIVPPPAEDATTRVYRDGFFARQVTSVPPAWHAQGKEWQTYCPWSQLAKHPLDGQFYCPLDHSVESMKTQHDVTVVAGNYASMVIPSAIQAAGIATAGSLIGEGLRHQNTARMTQSVNSNGIGNAYISTYSATPIPGLPNGK